MKKLDLLDSSNFNLLLVIILFLSLWQIIAVDLSWVPTIPILVSPSLNHCLSVLSRSYICSFVFYVLTVYLPFKQHRNAVQREITLAFSELEEEVRTIISLINGKSYSQEIDPLFINKEIVRIAKCCRSESIEFPMKGNGNYRRILNILESFVYKIQQNTSDILHYAAEYEYLGNRQLDVLQDIKKSQIHFLLQNYDNNISSNERIGIANELANIYKYIKFLSNYGKD